jgi:hypothetical protein
MIEQSYLKELLHYDPDTGVFKWLVKRKGIRDYDNAGSINNYGYLIIVIDGVKYKGHRLAWLFMHGECPEEIDHIDRNKSNNVFSNLRACTHSQNMANQDAENVYQHRDKFLASVKHNGKMVYGGTHDTYEEAKAVATRLKQELFGEYANGS